MPIDHGGGQPHAYQDASPDPPRRDPQAAVSRPAPDQHRHRRAFVGVLAVFWVCWHAAGDAGDRPHPLVRITAYVVGSWVVCGGNTLTSIVALRGSSGGDGRRLVWQGRRNNDGKRCASPRTLDLRSDIASILASILPRSSVHAEPGRPCPASVHRRARRCCYSWRVTPVSSPLPVSASSDAPRASARR
jgi:hypothetical protein